MASITGALGHDFTLQKDHSEHICNTPMNKERSEQYLFIVGTELHNKLTENKDVK